ncbi:MAG TPA: glycosyltransferase family 9 protein [Nevskiaceae bacterium]|nr:glycosyltransferase family 9 protein [Nevskiaceae bacterium]
MKEELACLIVARNLGDAVIHSMFFAELVRRGYAQRYLVWARPQAAFLFAGIGDCELVTSPFPAGTNMQMGGLGSFRFLRAAAMVRGKRPSVTIDLIGDFRERWFASLAGSRRHRHIGWAEDHPFHRLIRNPFGTTEPVYRVPATELNVYSAYARMLDRLAPGPQPASLAVQRRAAPTQAPHIGLHPFASQRCREWPLERWRELGAALTQRGCRATIFGAPPDAGRLHQLVSGLPVNVHTGSTAQFAAAVAQLDGMVALDSFALHLAARQGVPAVMINGANDHRIWQPPSALVLAESGGCPVYPCYNKPSCVGGPGEYACIRAIGVGQVLTAVEQILGMPQLT